MRESQRELEHLAVGLCAITYADEFHLLLIAVGNAFDHVVNQGAGQTVLGAVLAVVGRTGYNYVAVFNRDGEVGIDSLFEFAFGSLDGNDVGSNVYGHTCGECNGSFTYT